MIPPVVLTILFAASAVLKAVELVVRRQERVATALLAASFASLTGGLALSDPSATRPLDELGGGVGKLVYNGLTLLGIYLMLVFFLRALHGPAASRRIRWEGVGVAATMLAAVVLIALTPAPYRGHTLASPYLARPVVFSFYLIGGAYFVHAYLAMSRMIWVYARDGRGPLVWALRVIVVGLFGLILTSLVRIGRVLAVALGSGPLIDLNSVNFQINVLSYIVLAIGLVVAGWGQVVVLWRTRRERRRQFRELEPLWTVLTALYPEIVLRGPDGARPWWLPDSWTRRLYRRVLECRDGLLRAGPVIAVVAGTTDPCELGPDRLALHLRELAECGAPPGHGAADPADPVAVATPAGAGLVGDVDALVAISHALPAALPRASRR